MPGPSDVAAPLPPPLPAAFTRVGADPPVLEEGADLPSEDSVHAVLVVNRAAISARPVKTRRSGRWSRMLGYPTEEVTKRQIVSETDAYLGPRP